MGDRDRTKAKLVAIARPGSEIKFVAPGDKSVFEFNGWVLAYKLKIALGITFLFFIGGILGQGGIWYLVSGMIPVFLVALIMTRPCP